jgi:hypothetical protein
MDAARSMIYLRGNGAAGCYGWMTPRESSGCASHRPFGATIAGEAGIAELSERFANSSACFGHAGVMIGASLVVACPSAMKSQWSSDARFQGRFRRMCLRRFGDCPGRGRAERLCE